MPEASSKSYLKAAGAAPASKARSKSYLKRNNLWPLRPVAI
ncbi:hypothetical protein [Paenibacillus herberti]|nr:hypothetical protein [Paenibacillus herberti]